METIRQNQGINRNGLRTWALMLTAAGLAGRGVIQNHILGVSAVTNSQLMAMLDSSQGAMMLATVSLVLQLIETCAVPMFALLLAEGFRHTSDLKGYALRITGCALLSEIPYNLLMGRGLADITRQNPVFGMVLALVVLEFLRRYQGKRLIQALVVVCALVWCKMLRIDLGGPLVALAVCMDILREKPMYRNLAACAVAVACSVSSLFFLVAPMGCLMLHSYNGQRSEEEPSRAVTYLAYPVMVLVLALTGLFLV